jgi:hypothetical protein
VVGVFPLLILRPSISFTWSQPSEHLEIRLLTAFFGIPP